MSAAPTSRAPGAAAPQAVGEVLTLHQLRLQLIPFVRAGVLDRRGYDSLFEVLCEAHNYLPAYRDDVTRAVALIAHLTTFLADATPTAPAHHS